MPDATPRRRVLLVEDEWLIAAEMEALLEDLGCEVIGPAGRVAQALQLIEAHRPDAALLDVSLGPERSFPIAETLTRLGVPFLFLTGYMTVDLPAAFAGKPILSKPVSFGSLRAALDAI
jgi:CheY-like chemotaxis protein